MTAQNQEMQASTATEAGRGCAGLPAYTRSQVTGRGRERVCGASRRTPVPRLPGGEGEGVRGLPAYTRSQVTGRRRERVCGASRRTPVPRLPGGGGRGCAGPPGVHPFPGYREGEGEGVRASRRTPVPRLPGGSVAVSLQLKELTEAGNVPGSMFRSYQIRGIVYY